jgi:hypothetical protein
MAYSTIIKPNTQMNPVIYTGTGSAQFITTGFQPDWTWTKIRNTTGNHREQDSVRGIGKELYPNLTNVEDTNASQAITSWTSTGYNIGTDTGINNNGSSYVAWNWKGGGTASSNTDGTITSSVSANTTAGFSIVGWTGTGATATVGHGLGTTPKLFIVKERSEARNWPVVTTAIDGSWDSLYLNLTDTVGTSLQSADSSVFNFTSSNEYNASGQTYIAYAFADVKGFSKFGSYTGNGSADGTFIYTGFKPAFIMLKRTDVADSWYTIDTARGLYNSSYPILIPNSSASEFTTDRIDLLSNGFKQRYNWDAFNASGGTYIYMAFAENPLVSNTSGGIPTTAR